MGDNVWIEAKGRYADYRIGVPPESSRPSDIADLINKMYNYGGDFKPTGMKPYKNQAPYIDPAITMPTDDAGMWKYLVDRGQVKIVKGDTFNTQEGNIYDFGGYWVYNLGNCYVENHIDQNAVINKKESNDEKGYDLLNIGGPDWTAFNACILQV
jgi:hypothetical protein